MQRQKALTKALIIIGALIVILGTTLALTVPQEVTDLIRTHRQKMLSGEWGPGKGFGDSGRWEAPFRGWGHPGFFGRGHGVGLIGLTIIAVLAGGFLFRRAAGTHRSRRGRDAVEILREEFASGVITVEEFAARRRVLEHDGENE